MDINSFLGTALWSTIGFDEDESGNSDHLDASYSIDDVSDEFKEKCQDLMDCFVDLSRHLFTEDELENSPIEHDLWLTLHGHGAGFWDGDYKNGDEITKICKILPCLEDELRDDLYRNK